MRKGLLNGEFLRHIWEAARFSRPLVVQRDRGSHDQEISHARRLEHANDEQAHADHIAERIVQLAVRRIFRLKDCCRVDLAPAFAI
jgi:hypothetical protein